MDKVKVLGSEIAYYRKNEENYISLTDMAKKFGDDTLIYSWMRNRNTLEFIGIWENCIIRILKVTNSLPLKARRG